MRPVGAWGHGQALIGKDSPAANVQGSVALQEAAPPRRRPCPASIEAPVSPLQAWASPSAEDAPHSANMGRRALSIMRLPSLPSFQQQASRDLGAALDAGMPPPFPELLGRQASFDTPPAFPRLLGRQASADSSSPEKYGIISDKALPKTARSSSQACPSDERRQRRCRTLSVAFEPTARSERRSPHHEPRSESPDKSEMEGMLAPKPRRRTRRCKTSVSQRSGGTPLVSPQGSASSMPSPSSTTEGSRARTVSDLGSTGPIAEPTTVISPQWRKGSQIGLGSYGRVFKAQDSVTGKIFAVKEAAVEDGNSEQDRKYVDRLAEELEICRSLRHPHIVSCLGHERVEDRLCIFLEYVPGGSIAGVLKEFGPLVGKPLHMAVNGSLDGLHYLHTHNPPVVHRDIKGANILVDLKFKVMLADFGCSKRNTDTKSFTTIGSIPWMAPEVIVGQAGHGRRADVWSLGCTVLEMATAATPWGSQAFDNIMAAIRKIGMSSDLPPISQDLPDLCRDFVSRCIRRSVNERETSEQLLQHKFVCDPGVTLCPEAPRSPIRG